VTDRIERKLWLHATTDKAMLVSPGPDRHRAEIEGAWVPISQVEVTARDHIRNPNFGLEGCHGAAEFMGHIVTLLIPGWLVEAKRLNRDAEVPA
jgi:hypothetical protein